MSEENKLMPQGSPQGDAIYYASYPESFEAKIYGALARGYCDDKNSHKVLDADLIFAMAKEVLEEINRKPDRFEEGTHDLMVPLFHLTKQIKHHVEYYSQDIQIKIYGPILHYCLKMYEAMETVNTFLMNLNKATNEARPEPPKEK